KYPALPELFIIVDEFGEFISENRDFLKLFSSITKVGRSLGIHLLLFSQYINSQVIGDIGNNLSFGISLAAANSSDSRFVVGTDAATHLKSGAGHAYLRREGRDDGLVMMQGFDVGAPYVPIIAPVADVAVSGDSLDDAVTDSTLLMPFTSISSAPLGDDDEAPIVIEDRSS
ncbi:hypothetical protein GS491_23675, partial [Rhodococcus hoagii]|nr:hypothetical protein [Prescottella equi]